MRIPGQWRHFVKDSPLQTNPGQLASCVGPSSQLIAQVHPHSHLDLVIGVCTSAIHLSAALGVPTWVMLGHQPDWRWLTRGEDTRWYPRMKLFRALPGEDWSARIERVKLVLATIH